MLARLRTLIKVFVGVQFDVTTSPRLQLVQYLRLLTRAKRTQRVARGVEDCSCNAKGDAPARRRVASITLVLRPEINSPLRHRDAVDVVPLRSTTYWRLCSQIIG